MSEEVRSQESATAEAAQGLGEAAIEGLEDLPPAEAETEFRPREEEPTTRIKDIHKAEAMAVESDEFRSKAAASRKLGKERFQSPELLAADVALDEAFDAPEPPRYRPFARRQHVQDIKDARWAFWVAKDVQRHEYTAANETAERTAEADFVRVNGVEFGFSYLRNPEMRAKFYDDRAAAIEEWAGILHDHPVSEAYLADHPGLEITPESLVRMEVDEMNMERVLTSQEYRVAQGGQAGTRLNAIGYELRHMVRSERGNGMIHPDATRQRQELKELLSNADAAAVQEWETIVSQADRIGDRILRLHAKLLEEIKIKPLRNQLTLTRTLLDDIYSGRASETGKTSADPAETNQPEQE